MTEAAVIALIQGIAAGLPSIIAAIQAGKDVGSIRVDEFISADALEVIRNANAKADDYIKNG